MFEFPYETYQRLFYDFTVFFGISQLIPHLFHSQCNHEFKMDKIYS